MQAQLSYMECPQPFNLQPGPAAACIMEHLSRHDKQQLALTCRSAHMLAISAVTRLTLGHQWYNSRDCQTTFPKCTCAVIRPRTMVELSKMAAELLLKTMSFLPALTEVHLQMQGVYDRQCDISLVLKSIALHATQLTCVSIEQTSAISSKAISYLSKLCSLSSLTLKSPQGFESGALSQLGNTSSTLRSLHLETTVGPISSSPDQPISITPSELARLQASDEVGLAKCTHLTSLTVINCIQSSPAAFRPVEMLLETIAGSLKPKLTKIVLANMPDLPASVLELLSGICSLADVTLSGCSIASSADLAQLSVLAGLTRLAVAPAQPSAAALGTIGRCCKRLCSLTTGCPLAGTGANTLSMPQVTDLHILAAPPYPVGHGSSRGPCSTSDTGMMSLRVQSALDLSGVNRMWPAIVTLEISGYPLDAAAVSAIQQLQCVTALTVQGSEEAEIPAKLLLPLLDMPALQHLHFTDLANLTDEWIAEAFRSCNAAVGGGFATIKELHLGAASSPYTGPPAARASESGIGGSTGSSANSITSGSSIDQAICRADTAAIEASFCSPSQLMTDKGLVRLFMCPRLQKLRLVQLPGISLAGIKALVRGSQSLEVMEVIRCDAVSAAPADAVARAAVAAPNRAVDLRVS